MERDEALLAKVAADSSRSYIRIYTWNEPTVSLGYFQKQSDDRDPRLADCPVVRRLTGGGAILHDKEVTYSCALPATHPIRTSPVQLYEVVHHAVIELLNSFGVNCCLRQDAPKPELLEAHDDAEPFLCFLRSDPRDIVSGQHKIVGSAQRRRRGSILQHGSILLSASALTPEVQGVSELLPSFNEQQFLAQLPTTIGQAIADEFDLSMVA